VGDNVISYPIYVIEEGLLVSWSSGSVDICDVSEFVRENEIEGGCDGPFGCEKFIQ